MSDRTTPSGQHGEVPSGSPARIAEQDDPETRRSLIRENESAEILDRAGYNIEQNPSVTGRENPDYQIEGRIFDCYAPMTANAYNIAETIRRKIGQGQTDRIILNLDDSNVDLEELRRQLISTPISGLQEIILVKESTVIEFFP